MFNFFSFASLALSIVSFLLIIILAIYGRARLHRVWMLFNIAVGSWATGAFYISRISSPELALCIWKIVEVGVIFIAVFFLHVTVITCNLKARTLLIIAYIQGVIFSFLSLSSSLFFPNVKLVFRSFYYSSAGPLFYVFFIIWMGIVTYSQFKLFQTFFITKGKHQKNQLFYFVVATLVGFSGGATNFVPHFGVTFYPFGNLTIILYCLIVTYAILKYRLMDISIAITRTGVFISVYSFVLGIPFALAFGLREYLTKLIGDNWWMVPLVTSTVLATVGPSIYLYIQKRAEDRLLQEQRQYQSTLRQASVGMGRIKDLKKLLNLIVHVVTRVVRIEHCEIFLLHEESNQFVLKASKGNLNRNMNAGGILSGSTLIHYLNKIKEPIVYEEIKQRTQDYEDKEIKEIEVALRELDAELIVPSFIDERMIAVITLGKKRSGKLYSQDDLAVFSILANQSALAIENAQFYEDMRKTHEQLFKAEKMATIGTMADGLSHQMNNRLHAMGFIAGDALDSIRLKKKDKISEAEQGLVDEVEHALTRIVDNVKQGGDIVEGLLKYTRKGEVGLTAVDLGKLLDAAIEMVQFKIRIREIKIIRNFNSHVPKINGNFTQLQEVFFNVIDNAYDALMQRKSELKELNYEATLQFTANKLGKNLEILVQDNGMGVKREDIKKIFTPFFTTKLSSQKGTGLGLYVIRQIIEENHGGSVNFTSEYKVGTQTRILLPIAGDV